MVPKNHTKSGKRWKASNIQKLIQQVSMLILTHYQKKIYPFEYKLMGYEPEQWTTFKCALLLKNMVNVLARHDDDLESQNAYKLLGC